MQKSLLRALWTCLTVVAILISKPQTSAASPAPPTTSLAPFINSHLEQLITDALQQHPQLQMAKQAYLAAKARIPAARAVPDPVLTAGINNMGINKLTIGTEPMSGVGASIQQNYPNPVKLEMLERVAYRQSLQLEQDWHLQERQLRRQIQKRYFGLLENQQAQSINLEIQQLFKALQETASAYYALGKVPQKEVWRIKTERSQLDLQLLNLKQEQALLLNQLRQELGWIELQADTLQLKQQAFSHPALPEFKTLEARLTQHPLWQQQSELLHEREHQLALAQAQASPDYMIMGGLTQRGLLEPSWELQGGMSLPIYIKEKLEPEIEGARLAQAAQQFQLEQTRQTLLQALHQSWIQIRESRRQQVHYQQQLIPEARLVFEAALALFPTGQADLLELIREISQLLRLQGENLGLSLQEYEALSDLEYLAGVLK